MIKRQSGIWFADKVRRTALVSGLIVLFLASSLSVARAEGDADQEDIQAAVRVEIERMLGDGSFDGAIARGVASYVENQRRLARESIQRNAVETAKNLRPVSAETDHIYGNPEAEITLIEYSDFECPFCKRFHPNAKKLVDDSNGEINWVYRHFPLAFHNPGAQKEAESAECAADQGGDEAFWRYIELIYERTRSNGKGFPIANLVPLAKEIGLDESQFSECLESGKMAQRVKQDYDNGVAAGVSGTPGNFLLENKSGNLEVVAGALSVVKLLASIEKLRKTGGAKRGAPASQGQ